MSDRQPTASAGERIRKRRLDLRMTQTQLGGNRFSKGYVSLVERGKLPLSRDALAFFAGQLGRPAGWFLTDPEQEVRRIHFLLQRVRDNLRNQDDSRARLDLREAEQLARDLADERQLANSLEHLAHLQFALNDVATAVHEYREAATIYARYEDFEDLLRCKSALTVALIVGRSLVTARAECEAAAELCASKLISSPAAVARLRIATGLLALSSGHAAKGRDLIADAARILRPANTQECGAALFTLAMFEMRDCRWLPAARHLERAVQLLSGDRSRLLAAAAGQWLVEAWNSLEQWDRVIAAAQQSIALCAAAADPCGVAYANIRLSEALLAAGEVTQAGTVVEEAEATFRTCPAPNHRIAGVRPAAWRSLCEARLAFVRAAIINRLGKPAQAEPLLRQLAGSVTAAPASLLLRVQLLHELAACLIALGKEAEALGCFDKALRELRTNPPVHDQLLPDLLSICRLPSPLWSPA